MKNLLGQKIIHTVVLYFCLCVVRGQSLDQIGLTALRAVTTNLAGAGIRVAQVEAPINATAPYAFEVNPTTVGQPVGLFTYISGLGSVAGFTNSVGIESGHAGEVGQSFYGQFNGIATNVLSVDSVEANFFYSNYISSATLPNLADAVVNQSFTFNALSVSDQQQVDSQYDNYAVQNNTLFASAANNLGYSPTVCAPGTSYNCLSVGAYFNGTYQNSIGPTIDNGRCKPDITAPGSETSYSTPLVAGASVVLMQAALRGDGGSDTNSARDMRTIKALLLNGAMKTPNWTNSTASPLDARYGAGVLNLFNSYEQLAGGKNGFIANTTVSGNGLHLPNGATGTISVLNGWDFNTNTSGVLPSYDSINHYYFNLTNSPQFIGSMTLVWNRHQATVFQPDPVGINNLNLFLYNCANSNLVNCSTSMVDNVEHIYLTNLPAGRYDLQVWKAGGASIVSAAEPYALAWEFISPTLAIASAGSNVAIHWPLYPAGFSVEMTPNLSLPVSWSTNNLPASVITNGQNYLWLGPTNPAQFFRLSNRS